MWSANSGTPKSSCIRLLPIHLSSYILPRDPRGRLRSYKLLNRAVPCELVCNFISSHPSMSRDPIQPHSVPGRDIIQRLLALLYQWRRCFGGLKNSQSRLAVGAYTHVFLWSNSCLNFISTGQDSICLSLKKCTILSRRNTELSSHRLPIDFSSVPLLRPGPICKQDAPFNYRWRPMCSGPLFSSEVTTELEKRILLPEGDTRNRSLILGSLERALFNLTDMGRPLT